MTPGRRLDLSDNGGDTFGPQLHPHGRLMDADYGLLWITGGFLFILAAVAALFLIVQ